MGPNWRQKHTSVKRNAKSSPTACVQAKFLLTLSKSLENLKHWKTIFSKINKKASPQMEVYIETEYRELFKGLLPLQFKSVVRLYKGIFSFVITSKIP